MKWLSVIAVCLLPSSVMAAQLIPCGNEGQATCQWLHVPILVNNVVDFLVMILASLAVLIIVYAGVLLVTAGADAGRLQKAKELIFNALIGFIIVLAAWLIVDTVIKVLISEDGKLPGGFGPWNEIPAVTVLTPSDPEFFDPKFDLPEQARTTALVEGKEGAVTGTLSPIEASNRAQLSNPYASELCAIATDNGIGEQCNTLRALMAQESGGNPGAVSSVGATGLMQVMPDTARAFGADLFDDTNNDGNISDAEIQTQLQDPELNMQIGVRVFANELARNGGDVSASLAAYNGGGRLGQDCNGAICASNDCPGALQYQCPFAERGDDDSDGIGCWEQYQADLQENSVNPDLTTYGCDLEDESSDYYVQTRPYVANINQMSDMYE